LENEWKPDIAYMGTFGQKLDKRILDAVTGGVFNTHPYDGAQWPSKEYAGLPAFQNVLKNRLSEFVLALHVTNEALDDGKLVCHSSPVKVPYAQIEGMEFGKQVQHLHKVMAPVAAEMIDTHLRREVGMPVSHIAHAQRVGTNMGRG
jgi:folate-dependent phosphoribosylglycinamide formyltransferase PurN